VVVRYLYQTNRVVRPEETFAQFVAGWEVVRQDPRVVGLNLVAPEDNYSALANYDLHMTMLGYLHGVAPAVPVSLHAGELAPGLVPPEQLRFHIRRAVVVAQARRIGHGVDVMYEDDPFDLLAEMARRNVMVEVNLTSNDLILGVTGANHPFPIYRQGGVPVALSTDDEGVARSSLTQEFQRAVETYGLGYADLKQLVRTSLEHSFLPGERLLPSSTQPVDACAADTPGSATPSGRCQGWLETSEKARLQWRLEAAFAEFERGF
jgi:adenosine deaminase